MTSLYTPVFPQLPPPSASASSSNATPGPLDAISAHTTRLSSIHLALSKLDPELCPPSPLYGTDDEALPNHDDDDALPTRRHRTPPSPTRTATLRAHVLDALRAADGERSSGKWGQVARRLGLGRKGRWGYREFAARRRAQGGKEKGKGWVLVETEEEWGRWERERERGCGVEVVGHGGTQGRATERVKVWQREVRPGTCTYADAHTDADPSPLSVPVASEAPQQPRPQPQPRTSIARKMKKKGRTPTTRKLHPAPAPESFPSKATINPLLFPARKPFAPVKAKGEGSHPRPLPEVGVQPLLPPATTEERPDADMTTPPEEIPQIGDISEMHYISPSFTPVMRTPTSHPHPPPEPQPQPPIEDPVPVPGPAGEVAEDEEIPGLGLLSFGTPTSVRGLKRRHTPPPPAPEPFFVGSGSESEVSSPDDAGEGGGEDARAHKKMRPTPAPAPRSHTPMGSELGLELGNAPILLVPSTPDQGQPQQQDVLYQDGDKAGKEGKKDWRAERTQDLPTLDELLASSRRSAARPQREGAGVGKEKDHTPTPTPARSTFSSPASATPTPSPFAMPSSALVAEALWSPGTPAPDFAFGGLGATGTGTGGIGGLGRAGTGSSGFGFGLYRYGSDVEGQDRVSELLEKDVDFEGWLRDVGEDGEG